MSQSTTPQQQLVLSEKGSCQLTVPMGNRPDGTPRKGRASYANIARPKTIPGNNAEPKYTLSLILDPDDCREIWNAILLVAQGEFGATAFEALKSGKIHSPLRNGDDPVNGRPNDPAYRGKFFINLSSTNQPQCFGWDLLPVDPKMIYSGCFIRANVGLFRIPQKWGKRGVGAAVNAIQFVAPGDPLSDAQNPQKHLDAFRAAGAVPSPEPGYGVTQPSAAGAFAAPPNGGFGPPAGHPENGPQPGWSPSGPAGAPAPQQGGFPPFGQ